MEIGASAFNFCDSLERIVFPVDLKFIGKSAFEKCSNLRDVIFSKKLYCISESAFKETALKSLDLPSSLEVIERCAFEDTLLENVFLPENIQVVAMKAFGRCKYLEKIVVPPDVQIFSMNALFNSPTTIYCSEGSAAHLAARKTRRKTVFIDMKPTNKKTEYVSCIKVYVEKFFRQNFITSKEVELYRKTLGMSRADTWSWNVAHWNHSLQSFFLIEHCYSLFDALILKDKLERPGVRIYFDYFSQESEDRIIFS